LKKEPEDYMGFEALYFAALDSDVSLIVGVPGYPITSLMELFLEKAGVKELSKSKTSVFEANNSEANSFEADYSEAGNSQELKFPAYSALWFTNEKAAMETALGSSVSGRRALVLVKHVGMNLLSDPLITSVTHTIGAGLVVIAGDDPGVKGSQNEQDSRWYGRIAEIAVFDPADPDSAYRALRRAYELSEETKTPVILRVTASLGNSAGRIKRLPRSLAPHPEFDRSVWENRTMEKHQLFHSKVYPLLEAEAENTDLNKIIFLEVRGTEIGSRPESGSELIENGFAPPECGSDRIGIISSGFVSTIVEKVLKKRDFDREISHLSLNLVNPLPLAKVGTFLRNYQKVLVAEESEPFIEEQIRIAGMVYGKKTGHLPYGQLTPEDLEFALEHIDEDKVSNSASADAAFVKKEKSGRTTICDNCPYLPLYRFLSTLDLPIAGDMGCSIRSAPEPLAAVDVSFALGSAISVACGFKKKGVAVIGDFAMAHSGILGLINAANTGCNVLVLILQNEIAAMTGGQEVPDLSKVIEAITPDVSVFDIDPNSEKVTDKNEKVIDRNETKKEIRCKIGNQITNSGLSQLIRTKIASRGVSVIFIKGKCKKY
jgi:indolepyruvate ferredoxin oxidoreductase alpha subunit